MFYQIESNQLPVAVDSINPDQITFGVISLEELEKNYTEFSFAPSTVAECKYDLKHMHSNIDIYEDYCFGIINGINQRNILKVQDRIALYIKRNLFLIVIIEDEDGSVNKKIAETLERLNLMKVTLERVIYGFLERLISNDHAILEQIELQISAHEDRLNENKYNKNFNFEITNLRKKLLLLHNYFEQLITFGEALQENGNDLFDDNDLRYFKIFTDRVTRLSDNTRMLREYIAQVKESYQAQMDYNLNNIMKLFTVVTTIFLPLTLIVGWYGMNFTYMPELRSEFGYPSVIIVSLLVVVGCIIYFKRKKYL